MEKINIYNQEELEKMSLDELDIIFDEFGNLSNEYSHLLLGIIESKGG